MISHPFPYRLIRSNRKTLAIQVSVSGQVIVRAPRTMSDSTIHRFLSQKESWVLEHISRAASVPSQSPAEDHVSGDSVCSGCRHHLHSLSYEGRRSK